MSRVIVMGVAGCGKSTVGAGIADKMTATYLDGDDLHPPENIEKMSAGQPLTDADRAPWLDSVGDMLASWTPPILVGCSALKRAYRDRIRAKVPDAIFLHLAGDRSVIEARMGERKGHFMPTSLLDSQFADLEPLGADERGVAIDIDQPLGEVISQGIEALEAAG